MAGGPLLAAVTSVHADTDSGKTDSYVAALDMARRAAAMRSGTKPFPLHVTYACSHWQSHQRACRRYVPHGLRGKSSDALPVMSWHFLSSVRENIQFIGCFVSHQPRVVTHSTPAQAYAIYKEAMMRPATTTSLFLRGKGLLLNGIYGGAHSSKATFVTAFEGMFSRLMVRFTKCDLAKGQLPDNFAFSGDSLLPKLLKIPHNDGDARRECELVGEVS